MSRKASSARRAAVCLAASLLLGAPVLAGGSTPPTRLAQSTANASRPGPAATSVTVVKAPYLLWVTETEVIVMWETSPAAPARLTVTPAAGGASLTADSPGTNTVGQARITGLTPGTRYTFTVDASGQRLGDGAFTTDSRSATQVTVGIIGDNRTRPDRFLNLNTRMMRHDPELILNVGDVVTYGPDTPQWNTEFFTPSRDVFRFAPCYVSIGNHESNTPLFRRYLPYPETMTGSPVESRGHYFSFLRGNIAFLAFDNYYAMQKGSPQYQWIESKLASSEFRNATWRIVFCHEPAYSVGWPGFDGNPTVRNDLVPLFEKYGVDIFFNGHTHSYERGVVNNVVHIINGGGGAGEEAWGRNWPFITKYGLILQYSILKVDGDRLELTCYDDGDHPFDRFILRKGEPRTLSGAPVFVRGPQNGSVGRQYVTLKYPTGGAGRFRYRVAVKERRSEDGFWESTPVMFKAGDEISLPVDFKAPGTYHVIAQALDAQFIASDWVESAPVTIQ